jgi:hypothetical protein
MLYSIGAFVFFFLEMPYPADTDIQTHISREDRRDLRISTLLQEQKLRSSTDSSNIPEPISTPYLSISSSDTRQNMGKLANTQDISSDSLDDAVFRSEDGIFSR